MEKQQVGENMPKYGINLIHGWRNKIMDDNNCEECGCDKSKSSDFPKFQGFYLRIEPSKSIENNLNQVLIGTFNMVCNLIFINV
jgi:hypothetical protein